MSAESGKTVERFDCTNGGAQFCNGCYTMTPDSEGEYVRHEDYAKFEQQRAALVEALADMVVAFSASPCPYCSGDCSSANPPVFGCPLKALVRARAALRAAGVVLP